MGWLIAFFFLFLVGSVGAWVFAPAISQCNGGLSDPAEAIATLPPASCELSVVVPAYNEEDRLPIMLDHTLAFFEAKKKADRTVRACVRVLLRGYLGNVGWGACCRQAGRQAGR